MARCQLTASDREEISRCLVERMSNKEIAAHIGRDPSVVCREVKRHGGREAYRAHRAERDAVEQRKRPKCRKLDADLALREQVVAGLRSGWSPEQIAGRLRREHGYRDPGKVASHEAIYTWMYALPKGELAAQGIQLRHGREQRRPRGRAKSTGARIVGMRSIEDRSAEVAGRAVPGHWEGDLIIGKAGKSAAATLVERTSRFTAIIALTDGRTADAVCDALIDHVPDLPGRLINSITWDQGSEMAQHARLSLATEIDVYFAHPHSPWERGTNENTNSLIREYLPKGTNIPVDQLLMNGIADSLNNRPRKVLGFMTPAEKMVELPTASIAPID